MFLVTKGFHLTDLTRKSVLVWAFKSYTSLECCNDEKSFKEVMRRKLFLRLGFNEKNGIKNLI